MKAMYLRRRATILGILLGTSACVASSTDAPMLEDGDAEASGNDAESVTRTIPATLPDPDQTPPDTTKPVKVYILSGQSNMVGMGKISPIGTPGTLETITKTNKRFPYLLDNDGKWTIRNDVRYRGVVTSTANNWLTVGMGSSSRTIGPELGFGHVMGYYHGEPVLIIKASQGNRSLAWDILPPGSRRYTVDGRVYAGYKDGDDSWSATDPKDPYTDTKVWYAGKQYDDFVAEIHNVLDNFATNFPQWKNQGYKIAGFGWFQGHKDSQNAVHASRYEANLVNFIKAIRAEFRVPRAPFVIATGCGFPAKEVTGNFLTVANAQLNVSGDAGKYPEFGGNVLTVDTRSFFRDASVSPEDEDYHYNKNAETYMLVGEALGRTMTKLVEPQTLFFESFETPNVSSSSKPSGWALQGHPDYIKLVGESNPGFATPYGNQALSVYSSSGPTTPASATTSASILNAKLMANATYTLTFNVAKGRDLATTGYVVELLAINDATQAVTVLASKNEKSVTTSDMSQGAKIVFATGASHSKLGQRIAIRLKKEGSVTWQSQPLFDNIRLSAPGVAQRSE